MQDYCQVPPFIGVTKPNLLLMIDNSASMYDLQYTDHATYNFCANDPATTCSTVGSICSGPAICSMSTTPGTTSTTVSIPCTSNADCVDPKLGGTGTCPAGATSCTWSQVPDTCKPSTSLCNKSYATMPATTPTPVACTTDADCTLVAGDTCNNRCKSAPRPCADGTYSNSTTYAGYFNNASSYCYSSKSGLTTCLNSGSSDEFDGNATMPGTCTYGGLSSTTPFVCVNVDSGTGLVNNFVATGNFLNWLTMSKFDIEKQILTGGKYRSDFGGGDLVAESRGCAGRKFVKFVPGLNITFGVRGGSSVITGLSQATQYGQTYIEIYKGIYNTDACAAAMIDWEAANSSNLLGTLQNDTKCCLAGGTSTSGCSPSSTGMIVANQAIHDCYWYFNGHPLSNLVPIENACVDDWSAAAANTITDTNAGDAICSSVLGHLPSLVDGNINGYLGLCFTGGTWDPICASTENKDFCQGIGGTGGVTDPPSDLVIPGAAQNIPGFVMGLGLDGLPMMNDYTASPNGTKGFLVRVYDPWHISPWPPRGLIQDFSSLIRVGAMSFNNDGSAAECAAGTDVPCSKSCQITTSRTCYSDSDCPLITGSTTTHESCIPNTKTDGGKILTYIGNICSIHTSTFCNTSADCPSGETCVYNTGDANHTYGLIKNLDDIQATTWTPFGEAFRVATGYLARSNSYTSSPATSLDFRLQTGTCSVTTGRLCNPLKSDCPAGETCVTDSTKGDYNLSLNPSQNNCQKNSVLMITDGQSTADLNSNVSSVITSNNSLFPTSNFTLDYNVTANSACTPFKGSMNVEPLAWLAQHGDITNNYAPPAAGTTLANSKKINTYTVYSGSGTMDTATCATDTDAQLAALSSCQPDNLMCKTARYGGGTYYLAQDPATLKISLRNAFLEIAAKATSGTAASVLASGEGSGANLIQALFYPRKQFDNNTETLWAGSLQNLWYYVDPFFSYSNIREDTQSDNILHLKTDYIANMQMLGTCEGDPTKYCAIDSDCPTGTAPCQQIKVRVKRYQDVNGDGGTNQTYIDTIDIENIHSLWESGKLLWSAPASSRKIFTNCNIMDGTCDVTDSSARPVGLMNFKASNLDATVNTRAYLQASSQAEADGLVGWVDGYDKFCNTSTVKPCVSNLDCAPYTCSYAPYRQRTVDIGGTYSVWKLGDVLNSTPKIVSWMPLTNYHKIYLDTTYGDPMADHFPDQGPVSTYYITSADYMRRGIAFAGANDGMLHAFKLGTLGLKWPSQSSYQKATLGMHCSVSTTKTCTVATQTADCGSSETCVQDTDLGKEVWSFIPKNVLPYLKYIADPNYCHVYSVDLTPYVFDASIEGPDKDVTTCVGGNYWNCARTKDSWRTILIGGMRLGGGCKAKVCSGDGTTKCATDAECAVAGGTCGPPTSNSIGTPLLDPADKTKGLGYSSYFALDITDTAAHPDDVANYPPRLLWEFSNDKLGFSSSGPAIIRIKALKDPNDPTQGPDASPGTKDGRFFVVFGSGPTGPISDTQFLAASDQNLSLFILDLKTGNLLRTITMDGTGGTPDIPNAFSGSLLNANFDSDLDYQDDIIYSGYVRRCTALDITHPCSSGTWTDGGVGRLVTGDGTGHGATALDQSKRLDPANWTYSVLKDGTGPITSSVVKLQDNLKKHLWVYFGAGRYYYKTMTATDDNDQTRTLYGIDDPCFNTTTVPAHFDFNCAASAGLLTDVTSISAGADGSENWSIDMSSAASPLGAERVITDPLATSNGLVFFTTFAPYSDICTLGGNSYIWALKYDTGGAPGAMLKGKALVQVSTGKIEQVDLSTQFTDKGNRRTAGMEGVPPTAQGLSIVTSPPPVKRVLHMKER